MGYIVFGSPIVAVICGIALNFIASRIEKKDDAKQRLARFYDVYGTIVARAFRAGLVAFIPFLIILNGDFNISYGAGMVICSVELVLIIGGGILIFFWRASHEAYVERYGDISAKMQQLMSQKPLADSISAKSLHDATNDFQERFTDYNLEETLRKFIVDAENQEYVRSEFRETLAATKYWAGRSLPQWPLSEEHITMIEDLMLANRGKVRRMALWHGYAHVGHTKMFIGADGQSHREALEFMEVISDALHQQGFEPKLVYVVKQRPFDNALAWRGTEPSVSASGPTLTVEQYRDIVIGYEDYCDERKRQREESEETIPEPYYKYAK